MKRKKLTIFLLILYLLFSIGIIATSIMVYLREDFSTLNTTEFSATVKSVEIRDNDGDNAYAAITTKEHREELYIFHIKEIIDIGRLDNIQPGQTIHFRIENPWLDQFGNMDFIYIVSLRTDENIILSLDDYNQYMNTTETEMTIASYIILLLLTAFVCYLLLRKRINIFRKVNK